VDFKIEKKGPFDFGGSAKTQARTLTEHILKIMRDVKVKVKKR
jgi:hypothetical protein